MRTPHWEQVYRSKQPETLSWYQAQAQPSLQWIAATGVAADAAMIDIGGGASTLAKNLHDAGCRRLTVLDISATALSFARDQFVGTDAGITWREADITQALDFPEQYQVWHDRAVFHFMLEAADRAQYLENLRRALAAGGHLILATFAEDGPLQCSGLPVQRYSPAALAKTVGPEFTLLRQQEVMHRTPAGQTQVFIYLHFQRQS